VTQTANRTITTGNGERHFIECVCKDLIAALLGSRAHEAVSRGVCDLVRVAQTVASAATPWSPARATRERASATTGGGITPGRTTPWRVLDVSGARR
jgi:hypothetical protein